VSIYALVDPRTHEVRYAGQTRGSLDARLKGHIHDALCGRGQRGDYHPAKIAWIRSLLAQEEAPLIRLLGTADAADANKYEREVIAALWLEGADLLNYAETPRAWCGGADEESCTSGDAHTITVTLCHDTYIGLRLHTADGHLNDLLTWHIERWLYAQEILRFPERALPPHEWTEEELNTPF
jgi:hypothetical protein